MLSGELIGVRGLSGEIQREVIAGGSGSGTSDYNELDNLPSINDVELIGNKTSEELGLVGNEELADYVKNEDVSASVVGDKIVQRNVNAEILVPTNPKSVNAAVNKNYVDTKLVDYVKNTDYATADKAGVVQVKYDFGTAMSGQSIYIVPAYDTEIETEAVNTYRPLMSRHISAVVKKGLTANKLTLTDEEKIQAQNWIGATNTEYVDDKFNGANKAVSFVNYSAMISLLNALPADSYSVGQNVMIITLAVPDLWISEIAETSVAYTYVSDDDFVSELNTNGSVQVGYYKLSALETQKVDLTDYVKNTDYATQDKAGVIKANSPANADRGVYISSEGFLSLRYAVNSEIDAKTNIYKPIVPKTIDYAVKKGLTTNTETLTEEEKAAAQSWLGVPKFTATQLEDGSYSLTIGG